MAVSIHGNNGVVTTNGTAAAPSFAAPDTDTGLYFGTNLIHASTNGTARLSIIANGKVGIGTTAPTQKLEVLGTTNLFGNGAASVQWGDTDYVGHLSFASDGAIIRSASGKALIFHTNHVNERLRITSGGNIKAPDGAKIELGGAQTGAGDLSIWHDSGGNSYIKETGGGALVINADDFYLQNVATTTFLRTHSSGAIDLNHSGNKKFETTSSGATVTGTVVSTGLDVNGNSTFGANGSITSGANFVLSGNKFRVTGTDTVGIECQRSSNATIQCTETTNNTDLQLRANATGGLVRTATQKPLIFGTFQEERLRIHETQAFVTINSGNAENNAALIISKTDSGYAKLEFDVGTSQKAYVELDASEDLVHYGAAGVSQQFYAGGSSRMTILSGGNVGIGQSPNTKFNVALSSQQADGTDDASDWGAGGIFQLDATNSGTGNEILLIGAYSGGVGQIASGFGFGRENSSNWGTYLSFKTHSTSTSNIDELNERVRITAGGNVGIGTASPVKKFEVNGSARVSGTLDAYPSSTSPVSAGVFYNNSTGASADCRVQIKTYANQGADPYLHFDAGGSNFICGMKYEGTTQNKFMIGPGDSPSSGMTGGIYVHGNGKVSLNASGIPSRRFNVSDTTAVQIWTYGNCGAHFSAQYQSNTNSGTQYYNVFTRLDGSWDGYIVSSSDGNITLANGSDYRLKDNVVSMTNGIDIVKKLNPITYKWKASTGRDTSITMQGFLAHEVDEAGVIGAVDGEKDGVWDTAENPAEAAVGDPRYQGLSLERLVPALTAALKESIARIETLEAEVAALKGS